MTIIIRIPKLIRTRVHSTKVNKTIEDLSLVNLESGHELDLKNLV